MGILKVLTDVAPRQGAAGNAVAERRAERGAELKENAWSSLAEARQQQQAELAAVQSGLGKLRRAQRAAAGKVDAAQVRHDAFGCVLKLWMVVVRRGFVEPPLPRSRRELFLDLEHFLAFKDEAVTLHARKLSSRLQREMSQSLSRGLPL